MCFALKGINTWRACYAHTEQLILLFSRGPEGLQSDAEASCLYCLCCCVFCIAYFSPLCRDVVDSFSTLCTDTRLVTISLVMMQSSLDSDEFMYAMDAFQNLKENYYDA